MSERDRREREKKKIKRKQKAQVQSQKRSIYKHIFFSFTITVKRNVTEGTRDHDDKKTSNKNKMKKGKKHITSLTKIVRS